MNILIVTPLFPPAVGGASTYYRILTDQLLSKNVVRRIVVVTERCAGAPDVAKLKGDKLIIHRIFPERAGKDRERWLQYPKYIIQNVLYFRLPALCVKYAIDKMLIHGGLHNRFNTIWVAQRIAACLGIPSIADIRDVQLPGSRFYQLRSYEHIVCCSSLVEQYIGQDPTLATRSILLPVIQERITRPVEKEIAHTVGKYGLDGIEFLLYVGLIRREKGIDALLEIFHQVRQQYPALHLVLAGNLRDRGGLGDAVRHVDGVRSIGPISRREVLALLSKCRAAINVSPSEGMPRSSLEAMALGVPVILPPGIPEFDECCPDVVHDPSDLYRTVSILVRMLETGMMCRYPLEMHYPEDVIPKYARILGVKSQ